SPAAAGVPEGAAAATGVECGGRTGAPPAEPAVGASEPRPSVQPADCRLVGAAVRTATAGVRHRGGGPEPSSAADHRRSADRPGGGSAARVSSQPVDYAAG